MGTYIQDIVETAVPRAIQLLDRFPHSFSSMEEAQSYVARTLKRKDFKFGLNRDIHVATFHAIKDRVYTQVALQAYRDKRFTLAKKQPPRKPLRDAVEAGIAAMQALDIEWPEKFDTITDAKGLVWRTSAQHKVMYDAVPDAPWMLIANHVAFSVAMRAFEAGEFDLDELPASSQRKGVCRPPELPQTRHFAPGYSERMRLSRLSSAEMPVEEPDVGVPEPLEEMLKEDSVAAADGAFRDEGFNELVADIERGAIVWDEQEQLL